jgi:hypothetical protein
MMADVGLKVRIAIHESAHAVCARVLHLRAGTIEGNMPLASFDDKGTSSSVKNSAPGWPKIFFEKKFFRSIAMI